MMQCKRSGWRNRSLLSLAVLLVTAGIPAMAGAQADISSVLLAQSESSIVAYWTPERMASAQPVMMEATVMSSQPLGSPIVPSGPPRTAPASRPTVGPMAAANVTEGGTELLTQCFHCSIPFTQYLYFARYRKYPVSTVAKVFFTNNGGNFVCSGGVLFTDQVWTAGHCVANTDGTHQFSTNVLVCPSYDASQGGVNPAVGCWAGANLTTLTVWINTGSFEWDMGVIGTAASGTVINNHIGNAVGFLGLAWNFAEDQNWYSFGYPAAAPFNGGFIVVSSAEFGYEDTDGNNQGGPNSIAMGNSQTGGSSGGPWIMAFGTGNFLNGHNDWRHTAFPNEMNSPYFDTRACTLANAAGRPLTC